MSSNKAGTKRQRADTVDLTAELSQPETLSQEDLSKSVQFLEEATVRRLLIEVATNNKALATKIFNEVNAKKLKKTEHPFNFKHLLNSAESLVDRSLRVRPLKQCEMAYEVDSDLHDVVNAIENEITTFSSFDDKLRALAALHDVGELVMDASEEIGKSLKNTFSEDKALKVSIKIVIEGMTEDEKVRLRGPEGKAVAESFERLRISGEGSDLSTDLSVIQEQYFQQPTSQSKLKSQTHTMKKRGNHWNTVLNES